MDVLSSSGDDGICRKGLECNHFLPCSSLDNLFLRSLTSEDNLSFLFLTVPASFCTCAKNLVNSLIVALNPAVYFTKVSTASTDVFIDKNLTSSVETDGASL